MKSYVQAISSLDSSINFLPPDEKLFLARFILLFGDNWSYVSKADIAKHMKLSNSTVGKILAKIVQKKMPHEYIVEKKQYLGKGRPRQTYRLSDRFALKLEQYLPWLTRGEKPWGLIGDRRPYGLDNAIKILSAPTRYKRSDIEDVRLTDKNVFVLIFLWLYCETDKPLVSIKLSYLSEKTGLTTTDLKQELAKLKNKQLIYDWVSAGKITQSHSIEHDLIILYPATKLIECLTECRCISMLRREFDITVYSNVSDSSALVDLLRLIDGVQKELASKNLTTEDLVSNNYNLPDKLFQYRDWIVGLIDSIYDDVQYSDYKLGALFSNLSILKTHTYSELIGSTAEMRTVFRALLSFYSINKLYDFALKLKKRQITIEDYAITDEDLIVPIKFAGNSSVGLTKDQIENVFTYLVALSDIVSLIEKPNNKRLRDTLNSITNNVLGR